MINLVGFHIPSRGLKRPVLGVVKGPERGEWEERDKFWMLEVILPQVIKLGQTNCSL